MIVACSAASASRAAIRVDTGAASTTLVAVESSTTLSAFGLLESDN
jgi:hypothetical protein